MKREETFEVVRYINRQNSVGVLNEKDNVKLTVTVTMDTEKGSGGFEFYDDETGGEDWYAEGGIWLHKENKEQVCDYDGVFDLPDFIKDKLNEWGIKTDWL
jgi:hypothetical protein